MNSYRFGPILTRNVKTLILINSGVFLIQMLVSAGLKTGGAGVANQIDYFFALVPELVLKGFVWQIFTYQFLHGSFFHVLFNMFGLWMFGSELEEKWGSKKFLQYYLICGTGAGIFILTIPLLLGQPGYPTVGASGALFGILLAYAIIWPERQLLFMMFFPIKVKYYVLIIGFISFLFTFSGSEAGGISHVGHLGGLITGYFYILYSINSVPQKNQSWNLIVRFKNFRKRKVWIRKQKEMYDLMHMEQKVDFLLEKISKKGMKSLTNDEKKFLKFASEKMDTKTKTPHEDQKIH